MTPNDSRRGSAGRYRMLSKKKFSVLYVEDDKDSAVMLATLLGFSGIDVSLARSINEAVAAARQREFDLFLLDSKFPEGSGVELCMVLHASNPQTPIVFYSGNAFKVDKDIGLAAGAVSYFVKPYVEGVASKIRELASQKNDATIGLERRVAAPMNF